MMRDAGVLGEIAIRQLHIGKYRFRSSGDAPTYDPHLSGIPTSSALLCNLVLLVRAMNVIMALLAQGNQVIGTISTRLATLDMMHIEDVILRFPFAPLADVLIPKQHILTHIPEPQLRTLLVLHSLDSGVLDFLQIELRHLNRRLTYRQELVNQ